MKVVLFTFSLLIYQVVDAQIIGNSKNTSNMFTVDSSTVKIWYAFNAIDVNKIETYDDYQRLEIGNYLSKYYSHFVYNSDSLCTEWGKKYIGAQSSPRRMGVKGKDEEWSEYYYSEYFKDFSNNTLTEYTRMPLALHRLTYKSTENIPVQYWSILEDTLSIQGFICQKATCGFRGRSYTAWFTTEIPINNGPWKFGGLPGLILKVYDDDLLYSFECVKIDFPKKKYPIKTFEYKDYTEIDRIKLLKLQKEMHDDYFKFLGMQNTNMAKRYKKAPYNPLELE